DALELGDAAAAGRVGLEAVDGAGFDHPGEVGQVVPVLPRGHVRGHRVSHLAQAGQIIRGYGFFEPGHVRVLGGPQNPDGLLAGVAAVRVHVELDAVADPGAGLADAVEVTVGAGTPGLADLDLHPGDGVLGDPRVELPVERRCVIRGEPA